jgi:Putative prokaryotic signal transducing protein
MSETPASDNPSIDWVPVFRTGTDYEAEIVRDRLSDAGVPAVIENKRDHAFNLTIGDMARIRVLVQSDYEKEALSVLRTVGVSDDELTRLALDASPLDPDDPTLRELEDTAGEPDEAG